MKMKKLIFILLLIPMQLFSQNLVLNPSFENLKDCTSTYDALNNIVFNWTTPTHGTTDFISSCNNISKSNLSVSNGLKSSKFGGNYAGLLFHFNDNKREYIQGELSTTLLKGEKYIVSFYINLSDKSDYALKKISFLFTEKKINSNIKVELSKRNLNKLKIKKFKIHDINNEYFFDNKNKWILVSKEIIANGYENFITIGNFNKNSKTNKVLISNKNYTERAYYYIDMISVQQANKTRIIKPELFETKKQVTFLKNNIKLEETQIFENITFDFNSYLLSNKAKKEIIPIYNFLNKNKNTKISIYGHTDNAGSRELNKLLSDNRAKSVAEYLIELGLRKERVISLGYGDSKPIYDNITDKGRNKNRRVEFKITMHNKTYK
jgi:outer membrane protein OmpA-like peptidoglycan-associated protein